MIHRGARASDEQAYRALDAMAALEKHLMDALSAQPATYPRSALLLVGRDGLERRSAFGLAKATYDHQSLDQLLREYLSWVEVHDTGGGSDG
jgi:hypothetical protein